MKATRRSVLRVRLRNFGPGEVPDVRTYSRAIYITPEEIVIEFADAPEMQVLRCAVTGLAYRLMASGEHRPTRRALLGDRAELEPVPAGLVPPELHPLVLQVWRDHFTYEKE